MPFLLSKQRSGGPVSHAHQRSLSRAIFSTRAVTTRDRQGSFLACQITLQPLVPRWLIVRLARLGSPSIIALMAPSPHRENRSSSNPIIRPYSSPPLLCLLYFFRCSKRFAFFFIRGWDAMGKQCFASHVLCFILVEHRDVLLTPWKKSVLDGFWMNRDLDTWIEI